MLNRSTELFRSKIGSVELSRYFSVILVVLFIFFLSCVCKLMTGKTTTLPTVKGVAVDLHPREHFHISVHMISNDPPR